MVRQAREKNVRDGGGLIDATKVDNPLLENGLKKFGQTQRNHSYFLEKYIYKVDKKEIKNEAYNGCSKQLCNKWR